MNPTTEQPLSTTPTVTLAICIRNRVAAVALVIGGTVERVWRRHFAFAKGRSRLDYLADLLRRLTADHAIDTVVVEPGSIAERAAKMVGLLTRIIHLDEAKATLLSILAESPVAVVDKVVDKRGVRKQATAYLNFLYSEEGQAIGAKHFLRPRSEAVAKKFAANYKPIALFTVDEVFGGWKAAQKKHFDDGGEFDKIYQTK